MTGFKREDMPKLRRQEIKDVHDYCDVCEDILNEYLDSFLGDPKLITTPTDSDIEEIGKNIGFIYTQKAMSLYDRACERLNKLGESKYPERHFDLDIRASHNMMQEL